MLLHSGFYRICLDFAGDWLTGITKTFLITGKGL
jgi:hypothetical protein